MSAARRLGRRQTVWIAVACLVQDETPCFGSHNNSQRLVINQSRHRTRSHGIDERLKQGNATLRSTGFFCGTAGVAIGKPIPRPLR